MRTTFALVAASLLASVHAHFTLNYPSARGAFSDDSKSPGKRLLCAAHSLHILPQTSPPSVMATRT
jgi:hypothetical protein